MEHLRVITMIRERCQEYFHQQHQSSIVAATPISSSTSSSSPWIVADMMAGVGPFAIPLSLQPPPSLSNNNNNNNNNKSTTNNTTISNQVLLPLQVYANDLNPVSYHYLKENARINRIPYRDGNITPTNATTTTTTTTLVTTTTTNASSLSDTSIVNSTKNYNHSRSKSLSSSSIPILHAHNLDARIFLYQIVKQQGIWPDEVIMNLPQNAIDFLDIFIGLARYLSLPPSIQRRPLRIHVYGFTTNMDDPFGDIKERVAHVLQCSVETIL
jgi:tRNA G37 N-methylase Trm5